MHPSVVVYKPYVIHLTSWTWSISAFLHALLPLLATAQFAVSRLPSNPLQASEMASRFASTAFGEDREELRIIASLGGEEGHPAKCIYLLLAAFQAHSWGEIRQERVLAIPLWADMRVIPVMQHTVMIPSDTAPVKSLGTIRFFECSWKKCSSKLHLLNE